MSNEAPHPNQQDAADRLIREAADYAKARASRDTDLDRRAADREEIRTRRPDYPQGRGGR